MSGPLAHLKILDLSRVLDVPISFFFDDMPDSLAANFGGGLSGFIQAGQVVLANLAGSFSLPALAAQLSAALQASFGASFPELVAAFNNGFNGAQSTETAEQAGLGQWRGAYA